RRRGVGQNLRAKDVTEFADAAANHAIRVPEKVADVVVAHPVAVVAIPIVLKIETNARAHMQATRREPGLDSERLLERRISRRCAREAIRLDARAVEKTEEARRRPLM